MWRLSYRRQQVGKYFICFVVRKLSPKQKSNLQPALSSMTMYNVHAIWNYNVTDFNSIGDIDKTLYTKQSVNVTNLRYSSTKSVGNLIFKTDDVSEVLRRCWNSWWRKWILFRCSSKTEIAKKMYGNWGTWIKLNYGTMSKASSK